MAYLCSEFNNYLITITCFIMGKASYRTLKIVCVLALIGIVLWVAFYAVQTYFVLTTGSGH